ncbi:DNA-directed RNA polymerase subunit omega [Thermodesulfobium narugense DSM 14796]|uniref:DNA-directed RNA polymerase subunit omega n=1 Tax=Thermodesulfobium narugense DSM 14796 TaxID=747365 RepID=M1E7D7_9BACT|nr:DNA-directed RNA polymerase subunit omega [Thermodesulfobium narugense]AEE14420.1 DNA-directed RNA polymerase subunit omega [Thermodesulfobium narugense DSM 14796]
MIAPSLENALKMIPSRYALVIVAVKRAKEIKSNKDIFATNVSDPLEQAFEEIASGKIKFTISK